MTYSLSELESLFKEIEDIIGFVEGTKLNDRRNALYLANGESITYAVPNNSIAHLLGIKTEYLQTTGLFSSTDSFGILKEMCENPYRIYQLNKQGHLKYESFISKYIMDKIRCFKENIKINLYETEFICHYDNKKAFYSSDKYEKCNYIIVKQYEDESIGVIYLVDNNNSLCVPMSNRIFKNLEEAKEELNELLAGQDISMIIGNTTYNRLTDYNRNFNLPLNSKAEKITKLSKYKKLFNCSIDVIDDYKYTLNKVTSNRTTFQETDNVIEIIVSAIVNENLIDASMYSDSKLLEIINAWNDHIFSVQMDSNDGEKTYTSMITDLKMAKEKIIELEKRNQELQIANEDLSRANANLQNQASESEQKIEKVLKILKPEK